MGEVELLRTHTCQHPPPPAMRTTRRLLIGNPPNRGIRRGHTEDDDDDGRNWGRCSFTMAESSEGGRRWRFLWRERSDRDRGGGGVEVQACVRPHGDAKSTLCRSGGVSRSSATGIETALPWRLGGGVSRSSAAGAASPSRTAAAATIDGIDGAFFRVWGFFWVAAWMGGVGRGRKKNSEKKPNENDETKIKPEKRPTN